MLNINIYIAIILFALSSCIQNENIHHESQRILNEIDEKIYINIYMNNNLSPQFKKIQDATISIINTFEKYSDKEIDFDLVDIGEKDQLSEEGSIYNPLSRLDMHPIWVDKDSNYLKIYPYAIVHFKERSLPVLLYESIYYDTIPEPTTHETQECINQLEYRFLEAIYLLKQNEKKGVAFLQGNGELDSANTWDIRNTLSKYYKVDFFDIRFLEKKNDSRQLSNINSELEALNAYKVIIIAKPTESYLYNDNSIVYKYIIDQYIMHGGKVIWMIDGTSANMDSMQENMSFPLQINDVSLNDQLAQYGAKINHDLIQDERCTKSPILINDSKKIGYTDWQYNPKLIPYPAHIINNGVDSILTNFVSSINIINHENTTVLLSSSERSNILKLNEMVSLDIIRNPPRKFTGKNIIGVLIENEFRSAFSDISKDDIPTIIKKSPKNKMIIISDGDIIANIYKNNLYYPLGYYHYGRNIFDGNTNFILNAVHYLCDDTSLIQIKYANNKK